MKSYTYLLFYRHPSPPFLQENLDPTFYDFYKNPNPPISKG